jgi:polyisoprenoid-binding protein YceI
MPARLSCSFVNAAALVLALLTSRAHADPAPHYQVDTAASRVYVRVNSATRLGHVHGVEGRLASGTVTPGGAGELTFDMTTFTADTAQARRYVGLDPRFSASDAQKVTANLRGPDVLDVAQHPKAIFTITSCTPLDGQAGGAAGRYRLDGQFKLHGVTRPLQLTAILGPTDKPRMMRLHGSFKLLQSDYGIRPFSALGGLSRVADELQIWGDFTLMPGGK